MVSNVLVIPNPPLKMEYTNYAVLLIDDDVDDAEMTMYTLRKLNCVDLLHIDDGADALQYLFGEANPEPGLILLDLKMPKVDGMQILRKLKSDAQKKHIPVIALISSRDGQKYLESFGLAADGYLMKPVDCKNFLTMLTQLGISRLNVKEHRDSGLARSV
jgi:two-component system response regulator